tara:strand:+ start:156 stop:374 length:219 start_codon:yes stop_codon:yes gene_type:complete
MNRYKRNISADCHPITDTKRWGLIDINDIISRLNEYEELLIEADEYLSVNKLTSIGSGSILHQKVIAITGKH